MKSMRLLHCTIIRKSKMNVDLRDTNPWAICDSWRQFCASTGQSNCNSWSTCLSVYGDECKGVQPPCDCAYAGVSVCACKGKMSGCAACFTRDYFLPEQLRPRWKTLSKLCSVNWRTLKGNTSTSQSFAQQHATGKVTNNNVQRSQSPAYK